VVYWCTFAKETGSEEVDTEILSSLIQLEPEDKIISVGLTWDDMHSRGKYARSDRVLRWLPSEIEELKLGGYLMYSCVSRFASYCHKRGIDTLVDEDLTDYFLFQLNREDMPDQREQVLEGFEYYRRFEAEDSIYWRDFLKIRSRQPWFPQPRCSE